MDKAFDTVFQKEVSASIIARTIYRSVGEQFRYQCLYCGEEVYLAAADSTEMTPHFRHRKGNNDTECERYLGQPGAVESYVFERRKNSKSRIGFYFNIDRLTFEMGFTLSDEEIEAYSKKQAKLNLYTKFLSQPFFSIPISKLGVKADSCNYFTLNEYSNTYYVSVDGDSMKYEFSEIMRLNQKINIYRSKQQGNHYRRNTSDILYTDIEYVAISESKGNIDRLKSLQGISISEKEIQFDTLNKKFFLVKFIIRNANNDVRHFFQMQDYQIDLSEFLNVIWPPFYYKESTMVCNSDYIFVSTSFEMVPHGNIDVDDSKIELKGDKVYKIIIADKVQIHEKNIEVEIVKCNNNSELYQAEKFITYKKIFTIQDDNDYFLINRYGCTKLNKGSKVYLLENDKVIVYRSGHIIGYIYYDKETKPLVEETIGDILKYHPQEELFNPDDYIDYEAKGIVEDYLVACHKSGLINSIVRRLIMEKKL